MRAAQRNAKIAQAKAERPWSVVWEWVANWIPGHQKRRQVRINRHTGGGPLRLCAGEAPVDPPPEIVPKHTLRKARQRAQRQRERGNR